MKEKVVEPLRIAIHQPYYLPWLGYFHKMASCDLLVILDTVKFQRTVYQRRGRIKTPQGSLWLGVPVQGSRMQMIRDVLINNQIPWAQKHWRAITANYSGAAFADNYLPCLEEFYSKKWNWLADMDMALTRLLADFLNISTPMILASSLGVEAKGSELLLAICQKAGAKVYLSGISGKKYLQEEIFAAKGVKIEYQDFQHPVYPQRFGPFEPYLAAIDLLCNCGPDGRDLICGQR